MNMDLVVRTPRLPAPGQTVMAHEFLQVCGGKGANQAVAVARLGGRTAMIGAVGEDAFGQALLESLKREHIEIRGVVRKPGPSGVAFVAVEEGGENAILVVAGANGELRPADVDRAGETLRAASLVLLQLEIPLPTVLHTVRLCRQWGIPVLLNPAPAPEEFPGELYGVDILCPNQTETAGLVGGVTPATVEDARGAAELLLGRGAKRVVITLGALGAVAAESQPKGTPRVEWLPAFKVDAVDTVAAGDEFLGALAYRMAGGVPFFEACRFACAAAACAVTVPGAQASLPALDDVLSRLRSGSDQGVIR
jgi:ribokinase